MDSKVRVDDLRSRVLSAEYEHPFRWDPEGTLKDVPENTVHKLQEHVRMKVADTELEYDYLMLHLTFSHALKTTGEVEKALQVLKNTEKEFFVFNIEGSGVDTRHYGQAFTHILKSMKAFLLTFTKDADAEKISKIISSVPPLGDMNVENQAALHGLKGIFYGELSINGLRRADNLLSKAIEMSPTQLSWHFLKGKFLGRLRHVDRPFEEPGKKEKYHLELALASKKNASYCVHTAQMYRETAKQITRQHLYDKRKLGYSNVETKIRELNQKAVELYKECLTFQSQSPTLLFQCAKAFIKFPPPFQDLKLAKELLDKGLEVAPKSGYGNHTAAQYYELLNKPQNAIKHLMVCEELKIFPAIMDLLRLEYQGFGRGATDINLRMEAVLEDCKEKEWKSKILAHLMNHFLLPASKNLYKACQYAEEILRLDGNFRTLIEHHTHIQSSHRRTMGWKRGPGPRPKVKNIYEELLNEIGKVLSQPARSSYSDEEIKYLKKFRARQEKLKAADADIAEQMGKIQLNK